MKLRRKLASFFEERLRKTQEDFENRLKDDKDLQEQVKARQKLLEIEIMNRIRRREGGLN